MITLIDRQMVAGYFKAYAVVLTSLLSLYVIVDLFTNLDDFANPGTDFAGFLRHVGVYYAYRSTAIFDKLSEPVVLLAAVFTVVLMQRNNEQLPLLSAGVSTQRVVAPVLVCACLMLGLASLNTELLIPYIGDKLFFDKDDPSGEKELQVRAAYEPNLVHIEGGSATRKDRKVRQFRALVPEKLAGSTVHLEAAEAHYFPEPGGGGRWELTGTSPAELPDLDSKVLKQRDAGRYTLHVRSVDFDVLTRAPNWFLVASTWRLHQELQRPDSAHPPQMPVLFHTRFTRPVLGVLLVFLGVSVVLRDQTRNVFLSAGFGLVLCGTFFAVLHACRMLGDANILPPALAAWLPVMAFGGLALVSYDAVHT